MTDKEIGKTILMPKSSVQYNRNGSVAVYQEDDGGAYRGK